MDTVMVVKVLVLLAVANGAPIVAARLFGQWWATPVDLGAVLGDGRPLLGRSKTWRGLVCSLGATGIAAAVLGAGFAFGVLLAALSMLGDMLSSLVKRRLGLPPSSMALGLDQIPEALIPALYLCAVSVLSIAGVLVVVAAFLVGELLLSRLLYAVNIRDRPY